MWLKPFGSSYRHEGLPLSVGRARWANGNFGYCRNFSFLSPGLFISADCLRLVGHPQRRTLRGGRHWQNGCLELGRLMPIEKTKNMFPVGAEAMNEMVSSETKPVNRLAFYVVVAMWFILAVWKLIDLVMSAKKSCITKLHPAAKGYEVTFTDKGTRCHIEFGDYVCNTVRPPYHGVRRRQICAFGFARFQSHVRDTDAHHD